MRTILKNSAKTQKYLEAKPIIYMVACWARWGVREYRFEKFKQKGASLIPYVWDYNDHNGFADQYELIPLEHATIGRIFSWTFHEDSAKILAEALNNKFGFN